MAKQAEEKMSAQDREILRDLIRRIMEIANDPVMEERRQSWRAHASLREARPMILAEQSGVMNECLSGADLKCSERWHGLEYGLRGTIFRHESVNDDHVIEPYFPVNWHVEFGDFGVQAEEHHTEGEMKTSIRWDAPIRDLDADFHLLHPRAVTINREGTKNHVAWLEELFGDIMPVRIRGSFWWTTGLTIVAIRLIGLEGLMMAMYDQPEGLHRLMAFLRDDQMAVARRLEAEGLLTLNNRGDYVGSGGEGYTDDLPQRDWNEGDPVRLKDLWVLSESQETVGVSPEMFGEFIFPYQLDIVKNFGLTYYGCCEPVHERMSILEKIPNLRSVSVSPWANEEIMGEVCRGRYVYCRKPNPALISTERFDTDAIRADLKKTCEAAKGCSLELVMKDVHTLNRQPERLGKWVRLAREVSGG